MDTAFILSFLEDLRGNNNRDWFEKNKDRYIKAYSAFLELVQMTIEGIGRFDADIADLEPKKCAYRIYRDIRFSKDKTPYKTHFGAEMAPGGRRSGLAGYYIHLSPGESMVAGGIWHPAPENLASIRQEIDYNGKELSRIINNRSFKTLFGEIKGEKLKRAPKGYEDDNPFIDWLKFKDYLAYTYVEDMVVKGKEYFPTLMKYMKALKSFNDFLNAAVA